MLTQPQPKWAIATATSILLLLIARVTLVPPIHAQTRVSPPLCATTGDYEPAATTRRIVPLPRFGLAIAIPRNYRTMQRQDGSVVILHPDDFAMLQCAARGGTGAHGYYSEQLRWVSRDSALSLREQARWTAGYGIAANGEHYPIATEIIPYRNAVLTGYIVLNEVGYSVSFLGEMAGAPQLIEVSAACDCEVVVADLITLLDGMQPWPADD